MKVYERQLQKPLKTHFISDGQVSRIVKSLPDTEAWKKVGLLGHVATALLEEPHRHGDPIQEDLTPRWTLSPSRNDLQQGAFATP